MTQTVSNEAPKNSDELAPCILNIRKAYIDLIKKCRDNGMNIDQLIVMLERSVQPKN